MHVGFPERGLSKNTSKLVEYGHKVAVIEQTETPRQLDERLKKDKKGSKCISREIVNIYTKGLFHSSLNSTYEARYILAFKTECNSEKVGITFFDISTLKFYIGEIDDDESKTNFRTLATQIRPVEVLYDKDSVSSAHISILKNSPIVPVFSILPPKDCWTSVKTTHVFHIFNTIGP